MAFRTICVDHIGIACADLEAATRFYTDVLGLEVTYKEDVPEQGVSTVFIPCGETLLELLVDITPYNNGPVGRYIAKNGPGIQHIALRVDNVTNAIRSCQQARVLMIDNSPRGGAGDMDVAFIHPKSAGLLMELCSPARNNYEYNQVSSSSSNDTTRMYIECQGCGHIEEVNKELFVKILGGVITASGPYAWYTYLFAGTGLALPICMALFTGGAAMLAYADKIVAWLSKRYPCPRCRSKRWQYFKRIR